MNGRDTRVISRPDRSNGRTNLCLITRFARTTHLSNIIVHVRSHRLIYRDRVKAPRHLDIAALSIVSASMSASIYSRRAIVERLIDNHRDTTVALESSRELTAAMIIGRDG